jgi:hypothetical protein
MSTVALYAQPDGEIYYSYEYSPTAEPQERDPEVRPAKDDELRWLVGKEAVAREA